MKKLAYITLSVSILATFAVPLVTFADTSSASSNCNLSYQALEPIGNITDLTNPNNLPQIINAIFTVLISVGALMAVLMLTIGGIQYMVSGGPAEKNKGIKRAQAALWGIVLIAGSWLILHTINPTLLNFTLNSVQPSSTNCGTAATPSASVTPASAPYNAAVVNQATQTLENGVNPADPSGTAQQQQNAQQTLDQQHALNMANCTQNGGTPISGIAGTPQDPRVLCNNDTYKSCTPIASDQVTYAVGTPATMYECAYSN